MSCHVMYMSCGMYVMSCGIVCNVVRMSCHVVCHVMCMSCGMYVMWYATSILHVMSHLIMQVIHDHM